MYLQLDRRIIVALVMHFYLAKSVNKILIYFSQYNNLFFFFVYWHVVKSYVYYYVKLYTLYVFTYVYIMYTYIITCIYLLRFFVYRYITCIQKIIVYKIRIFFSYFSEKVFVPILISTRYMRVTKCAWSEEKIAWQSIPWSMKRETLWE